MTTSFCTGVCYQAPGTCNCGLRPVVHVEPQPQGTAVERLYTDDCGCQTIRSHRAAGSGKIDCAPVVQVQPVPRGWICAGCGQGWAPNVDKCEYCVPRSEASTTVRFYPYSYVTELD